MQIKNCRYLFLHVSRVLHRVNRDEVMSTFHITLRRCEAHSQCVFLAESATDAISLARHSVSYCLKRFDEGFEFLVFGRFHVMKIKTGFEDFDSCRHTKCIRVYEYARTHGATGTKNIR